MTTRNIAGHHFDYAGRCVRRAEGQPACIIRWSDIRNTTDADRGKPGIAHVGMLYPEEMAQIIAEREREDAAIAAAMGWGGVASG